MDHRIVKQEDPQEEVVVKQEEVVVKQEEEQKGLIAPDWADTTWIKNERDEYMVFPAGHEQGAPSSGSEAHTHWTRFNSSLQESDSAGNVLSRRDGLLQFCEGAFSECETHEAHRGHQGSGEQGFFLNITRIVPTSIGEIEFVGFDRRAFCENPFHSKTPFPQRHRLEIGKKTILTLLGDPNTHNRTLEGPYHQTISQSPACARLRPIPKVLIAPNGEIRRPVDVSMCDWEENASQDLVTHYGQGIAQPVWPQGWDAPLHDLQTRIGELTDEDELVWTHSSSHARIMLSREEMRLLTTLQDEDLEAAFAWNVGDYHAPRGSSQLGKNAVSQIRDYAIADTRAHCLAEELPLEDFVTNPDAWAW